MKKVFKFSSLLFMSAMLTISSPVPAQTTDDGTTTTRADNDDDHDHGQDWGWIGLAGLLGLLGLRKKDDRHVHVERRSDTPNTTR
jgi:MYXO-CTERM domain-containing protein